MAQFHLLYAKHADAITHLLQTKENLEKGVSIGVTESLLLKLVVVNKELAKTYTEKKQIRTACKDAFKVLEQLLKVQPMHLIAIEVCCCRV